jgi:hypothetical protein
MREEAGGAFRQAPVGKSGPQRGQFVSAEAGADADGGVVVSDIIATDEVDSSREPVGKTIASRFAGSKASTVCGDVGEEFAQLLFLEMMQEEIGDDDIDFWGASKPVENIDLNDFS